MAALVRLVHVFDCSPDVHWATYFDPAYTRGVFTEGLGARSVRVISDETLPGGERRRVLEVDLAPLELPGPVAKLLRGGFGYVETLTFDPARAEARFEYRFNQLADRLSMTGTLRTAPGPGPATTRTTEVRFEARFPGLGALVERAGEKVTRDSWEKTAAFTRRWLAR